MFRNLLRLFCAPAVLLSTVISFSSAIGQGHSEARPIKKLSCDTSNFYKISFDGGERGTSTFFAHVPEKQNEMITNAAEQKWDVVRYRLDEFSNPVSVKEFEFLGTGTLLSSRHVIIQLAIDKSNIITEVSGFANPNPEQRYALAFFKQGIIKDEREIIRSGTSISALNLKLNKHLIFNAFPEETGPRDKQFFLTCSCKGIFGSSSCCTKPQCTANIGEFCSIESSCKENGTCSTWTSCACRKD